MNPIKTKGAKGKAKVTTTTKAKKSNKATITTTKAKKSSKATTTTIKAKRASIGKGFKSKAAVAPEIPPLERPRGSSSTLEPQPSTSTSRLRPRPLTRAFLSAEKDSKAKAAINLLKTVVAKVAAYGKQRKKNREELAEILHGTKKMAERKRRAASSSAVMVNMGGGEVKYSVAELFKKVNGAGEGEDNNIALATLNPGQDTGEICDVCSAPIIKVNVTAEIPIFQQFNNMKFAKWCSNLLCSSAVNLGEKDIIEEQVLNELPPVNFNRPLGTLIDDENIPVPPADDDCGGDIDWAAKHQECLAGHRAGMFVLKEMRDAQQVLARILQAKLEADGVKAEELLIVEADAAENEGVEEMN